MATRIRGGLIAELSAEFAGTMSSSCRYRVVPRWSPRALTARGRTRQPRQHRLGLGLAFTLGVYARQTQRRAPQPGGHRHPAAFKGFMAEGGALRRRPDRGRVRRRAPGAGTTARSGPRRPRPHLQDADRLLHPPGNGSVTAGVPVGPSATRSSPAILLMLIPGDHRLLNTRPAPTWAPFIIGLVVVAIGMAFGTDAGYAINPAVTSARGWRVHHRLHSQARSWGTCTLGADRRPLIGVCGVSPTSSSSALSASSEPEPPAGPRPRGVLISSRTHDRTPESSSHGGFAARWTGPPQRSYFDTTARGAKHQLEPPSTCPARAGWSTTPSRSGRPTRHPERGADGRHSGDRLAAIGITTAETPVVWDRATAAVLQRLGGRTPYRSIAKP